MWQGKCSRGAYGRKWRFRRYDASSLTRSLTLRPFGCGGRCLRAHNGLMMYPQSQGIRRYTTCARKKEKVGEGRASGAFSIGSAPLTSITKSDAQISGGETRQDLKIPGVSPRWLPLALSCSRPAVYVLWWKPYLNHHVPLRLDSSLQAGLYARTPRSARLPRPFR